MSEIFLYVVPNVFLLCYKCWQFIREENTSPKCQAPSNVSICPLKSDTTTNCSQVKTQMRTTSCGIVLCDKTAHFRVSFYCGQPKAHLCNNHAV